MYPGLKITFEDVQVMRALNLHNRRVYTSGKLGQIFGLSTVHVGKIVRGACYKRLPFPIQPYAGEIAREFINNRLEQR
jgi:hypothetical protein